MSSLDYVAMRCSVVILTASVGPARAHSRKDVGIPSSGVRVEWRIGDDVRGLVELGARQWNAFVLNTMRWHCDPHTGWGLSVSHDAALGLRSASAYIHTERRCTQQGTN